MNHCQTIDVDGCRQTVKLQSVLRLCSGFYRSKDPTNSIKVLKAQCTDDVQIGTKWRKIREVAIKAVTVFILYEVNVI